MFGEGKVQWGIVVGLETAALSWCSGTERLGLAPGWLSETSTPGDLVIQPKDWDSGTWLVRDG